MKRLDWDGSLNVQVEEIDEDHRRLVDLFNLLSAAVETASDAQYIEALLEEMVSCTVWHFRHEERLMLQFDYPGIAAHKQEHEELVTSAQSLQQMLLESGQRIAMKEITFLEKWLTGHILGADMELGGYLAEKM